MVKSVRATSGLSSAGDGVLDRPGHRRRGFIHGHLALFAVALFACDSRSERDLGELIVQDSTYLDPETMLPYSGRVLRHFSGGEEGRVFLEATLRDGTWEGELTIYHTTGRIRYQGEMSGGARCGAWTENENPVEPENVYDAIKEDLESLVLFPECPEG